MNYYKILQQTPFPGEFENLPRWQIQEAEYNLKLNKTHYYEQALRMGDVFLYPLDVAERIVSYWRNRWDFATYQLVSIEILDEME